MQQRSKDITQVQINKPFKTMSVNLYPTCNPQIPLSIKPHRYKKMSTLSNKKTKTE